MSDGEVASGSLSGPAVDEAEKDKAEEEEEVLMFGGKKKGKKGKKNKKASVDDEYPVLDPEAEAEVEAEEAIGVSAA